MTDAPATLDGKKVFFPVESLTGLGHLNRTGKLVREMVKNGLDVTVASGSFVDPARFFAGAHTKEVPQIAFRARGGQYFALKPNGERTILPNFNEAARKEERTQALVKNVNEVHPDILVSEFWPFDRPIVDKEMDAVLKATAANKKDALKIVSVRDVLNTLKTDSNAPPGAEAARAERDAWAIKTINENFDAVLVHGDPNFIPLKETFAHADEIKVPVIYTGYVIDDLPKRTGNADDPNAPVVISCGAGVDCHELIFSFLTAWQKLLDRSATDAAIDKVVNRPVNIVCGPRFEQNALEEVKQWTDMLQNDYGVKITVDKYRDDFTSMLAGAAFSLSFAGYNTTLETLAIGTPHLLVPNYAFYNGHMKMNSEQIYRLERLKEQGLAAYAHPDDVQNPKKFADILLDEFTRQNAGDQHRPTLNFDGAKNTVAAIADLMEKKAHKP